MSLVERGKYYNSNQNLPKAGMLKEYEPWQLEEIDRCIDDPVYFAKTYFRIIHVDRGLIPFDLYDYQEDAIEKFMNNRRVLLNWARQSGKTSAVTVMILHAALFNENKLIALLANKGDTSREILHRIKLAYEFLPEWIKPGVKEWNKGTIEFENGSRIIAEASSSDNIRGKAVFMLYIDELAFVDNWDDFSASVLPTLSSGTSTKLVFTSTPGGMNHWFYYVKNARDGKNGFALSEVTWNQVPGRDEKWRQMALEELNNDQMRFEQEYNLEFIGSSDTLISGAALKSLDVIEPIQQDIQKLSRQYAAPERDHTYVLSADVSRGKGLDYSAFSVIDVTDTPYKQVFTYRNNLVTPSDFASIIFNIATRYNEAYCLIEINDLGQQVADLIFDLEYENIVYTESRGRAGKRVSGGFSANVDRGLRTTLNVKNLGCTTLKLLIEEQKLQVVDEATIGELNTFSAKGKSWEAEQGKHDDTVMCLVLFAWLSVQTFFKDLTDKDVMKEMRDTTDEELESDSLAFGFIDTGFEDGSRSSSDPTPYSSRILYDHDLAREDDVGF